MNIIIGILASMVFLFVSSIRLEAQGLYFDELHQAVPAFAYKGLSPLQFAPLTFPDIPIMNMNYSGAIKTAIYGLFLKIFDVSFSVISWRLVGIIFVSLGLALYAFIAGRKISDWGMLTFCFLFVTDITVILTTRHDWGPVAIALFLRLVLIAIWLREELSTFRRANNSFWLGCLVGISIFEKLSSVVLLLPLLLMLILSSRRKNINAILATIIGGFVGTIPLLGANLLSLIQNGNLISLQFQRSNKVFTINSFFLLLKGYLSLGAGVSVSDFILGRSQPLLGNIETVLIALILLIVGAAVIRSRLKSDFLRLSGIMLMCYVGILFSLFLFPLDTGIYHWVIGTPFQYTAIALFCAWIKEKELDKRMVFACTGSGFLLVAVIIFRLYSFVSVEQSLLRGDSSDKWDPSLTQIGEFTAQKKDEAIFIAVDWGISNQMICFLNGQHDIVYQMDWANPNVYKIIKIIQHSKRSEAYIIFTSPPYFIDLKTRAMILSIIKQYLAPEWQEQPPEKQVWELKSVFVYKFMR